jgi:small nuclear ribonucleoprotein (snRNP)-like protein
MKKIILPFKKEYYPKAKIGDIVSVKLNSNKTIIGRITGFDPYNHILIEID